MNQTAKIALRQIRDKGYLEKFNEDKPRIAIGINFNTEERKIDEYLIEEY